MGEKGTAGSLDGSALKVAIVVARYNQEITGRLLQGARGACTRLGVAAERLTVVSVPGALELPLAAQTLARTHDAVVCLGCVIKGDTAHFEFVCAESAAGVMRVGLDSGTPVTFGVLTTYDRQQALDRSGHGDGANKGAEAAETAIEMANLLRSLEAGDPG